MADHRDFALRLKQACDRSNDVPQYGKGQQTWIADRIGVSQEAVRRWFEGQSRPRPTIMTRLAKILNVDESWLALGVTADMTDKERKQYSRKAEAAAYMLFGVFMSAGYSCAFAEDDPGVDFHAIRGGKQLSVSVTMAWAKSKNIFVTPVRPGNEKKLNLCVVSPTPGTFDILVMDDDGVNEFGEAKTDTTNIAVKHERQGYHTEGHVWTQLKDFDLL